MKPDPFDAVAADFKRLETQSFTVPEWDGLEIFVRPMTLGDRTRLQEKTRRLDQFQAAAMTVCLFARGADEKLIFSAARDMPRFRREARPVVVARVAGTILALGEGESARVDFFGDDDDDDGGEAGGDSAADGTSPAAAAKEDSSPLA